MNIGQIKLWAWAVAGLLTLGLSWYVFDFVRHLQESQGPDVAKARQILDNVAPPKVKSDDILTYDEAKRLIAVLDWTGAPKAVAPAHTEVQVPVVTVVPVKKLINIQGIKQDLGDPKSSSVAVRYRPEASVSDPAVAAFSLLKEGDHLAKPNDFVTVDSITSERVRFTFADPNRPAEEVRPVEFDAHSSIVIVGPDGVIQEPVHALIPHKTDTFRPGRTERLGNNRYRLGADDVKEFGERYAEILGREVETSRHQDPHTGKYDGIEIKSVQPGSIAAQHGAQEGDVVKSINGHPVNSTQEAINFVKVNSDNYTTWEIVVENHGKTRTVTYESSNN